MNVPEHKSEEKHKPMKVILEWAISVLNLGENKNPWNLILNERSWWQIWGKIPTYESYTWMSVFNHKLEEKYNLFSSNNLFNCNRFFTREFVLFQTEFIKNQYFVQVTKAY